MTQWLKLLLLVEAYLLSLPELQAQPSRDADSWHQGCYHVLKSNLQQNMQLVPCARHCLKEGSRFTAVGPGASCMCVNDTTTSLGRLPNIHCKHRCPGVSIDLPCGGPRNARSLYTSAGPYLLGASTSVTARWVVTQLPHTLRATAQLASLRNCSKADEDEDTGKEDDDWRRKLRFVWDVGGSTVETDVIACTSVAEAHAPFIFPRTGNFTIKLTVSNAVSSVTSSRSVTVLRPRPRGLQLLPSDQTPLQTPSCINRDLFNASATPSASSYENHHHHRGSGGGRSGSPASAGSWPGLRAGTGGRRNDASSSGYARYGYADNNKRAGSSYGRRGSSRSGSSSSGRWRRKKKDGFYSPGAAAEEDEDVADTPSSPASATTPRPQGGWWAGRRDLLSRRPRTDSRYYTADGVLHKRLTAAATRLLLDHDGWSEDDDDDDGGQADDDNNDDDDEVALVAAFARERFELMAGVMSGLDPWFEVWVEDSVKEVVILPRFNVSQPDACLVPRCQAIVQDVVFPYAGVHKVYVKARNQHGYRQLPLTVVVMDREMGEVHVSVEEPQSAVYSTQEPLSFHLTVDTADRHNAFLYVIFGDGLIGFSPLRETKHAAPEQEGDSGSANSGDSSAGGEEGVVFGLEGMEDFHKEHLGERRQLLTGLRLTASYGEGCSLQVKFMYQYRIEGRFTPQVVIANNVTKETINKKVSAPLVVQNLLSMAHLHGPSATAVGTATDFTLQLQPTSADLTVRWLVLDGEKHVLVNRTTRRPYLSVTFNSTGVRTVTATAGNLLGTVQARASLLVQKAVRDLRLRCKPYPPRITVEDTVECLAEVSEGTHLSFAWNFGDSELNTEEDNASNLSSRAVHLYLTQGVYNVSVVAGNNVSSLVAFLDYEVQVDTEIRCFRMDATAAYPGQELFVEVNALGGTRVSFEYDFGYGRRAHSGDVYYVPPRTTALMSHRFDHPGLHPVRVYAKNFVSSAELSSFVVVQRKIGKLQLEVQTYPTAGRPVVIVVKQAGRVTARQDLIYQLIFWDGTTLVSASPVLVKHLTQNSRVGTRTVNVTAFNQVDRFTEVLSLEPEKFAGQQREPQLQHEAIIAQNQTVHFSVLHCPEEAGIIEVHLGSRKQRQPQSKRWSHVFYAAGVHTVDVTIYGGRAGGTWKLHSVLLVQQPITSLRLTGPKHVGIDCHNVWKAVSDGTFLVCQWSLGGEHEDHYTSVLQYGRGFSTEGIFTLGLHCHNDISNASATLNVTVTYPVTDVHLTIPVTVHSHPTFITATIHAGRHFNLMCDYGDSSEPEIFHSSQLKLVSVAVDRKDWQERVPVYNITIQHLYTNVGVYSVEVTVLNDISSLTHRKQVFVEEAIGDIQVFADVPDVVNLTEYRVWTFKAVVGSGENLKFAWDFDEEVAEFHDPPVSKGNTSVATHKYSMAGEFPVKIKVWNHLQREPVVAQLPKLVVVQEPVTFVTLKLKKVEMAGGHHVDTLGAHFDPHENRSHPLEFEAISDGLPVTFSFDFGDGWSQKLSVVDKGYFFNNAQAKHIYTAEGVYTVKVTASNSLSNVSTTLPNPVYVQVPVLGTLFELGTKICTPFGEETVLKAAPIQGSNITFTWKLDDQTECLNANSTVRHMYRQPGVETVEVIASNQVSSVSSLLDVNVVEKIQSVSIKMDSLVAAWEPVIFEAQVFPKREGLTNHFTWDLSRSTTITKKAFIKYTYRHSGMHRVTVTAHNCHSNATSVPREVHVVSRMAGLRFRTTGDNLVNETIKFSVLIYQGDNLTFTWDFGDGSLPLRTVHRDVHHIFKRVGAYLVKLQAVNPLGNDTISHRLFILTRFCKPPVVNIVGASGKTGDVIQVWKWQVLRIESQVTINCSVTGDMTYQWGIHKVQGGDWSMGHRTPVILDLQLLQHPQLLLPPHSLLLGHYHLTLEVSVNGTEIPVYQEVEARVEVMKTQIHSIILGGVLRQISRGSNLTLDGTHSNDPDNRMTVLSYMWTCHPLHSPQKSCFKPDTANNSLKLDGSRLEIDSAWFTEEDKEFLFNLTVSAPGSQSAHATQVVRLAENRQIIPLTVGCRQCRDWWVNSNDKVSLVARCHGDALCNDPKLRYRWQVSVVEGDNPQAADPSVYAHSDCVMADGSSYKFLKLANTTTTAATVVTTTGTPMTTTTSTTTTGVKRLGGRGQNKVLDDSLDSSQPMKELPVPPWQDLTENPAGPRSRTDTYGRGQSSRARSDRKYLLPVDIGEGTSEGGSQGRIRAGGLLEPVESRGSKPRPLPTGPAVEKATPSSELQCEEGSLEPECRFFEEVRQSAPHITTRKNSPLDLKPSHTASAPDGPSLVLRPGTLTQGLTYLVQVTASNPDEPEAEGLAMTYFRVNKSPRKGACSVVPKSGVEMDTLFKVFCKEWQDEQLPVWYEVSYSLEDNEDASASASASSVADHHVIYRGLSHQITFRLPAGPPENGGKVFLRLSIRDNWGASTSVCHIPVVVAPQPEASASSSSTGNHHHHHHPRRLRPHDNSNDHDEANNDDTNNNTTSTAGSTYDFDISYRHLLLQNDVRSLSRHLEKSVYRGDLTGVEDSSEVFTHLATRLNRLAAAASAASTTLVSSDGNNTTATIRDGGSSGTASNDTLRLAMIRFDLLRTLNHMPLRDQVEVGKTLRCLLHATQTVSQINGQSFALGVKLLEKISQKYRGPVISAWRGAVNHDVVGPVVQVVSNLLQAAMYSPLLMDVDDVDHQRFKWTQRSVDVIHRMITLALHDHSLGEVPLSHHTDFVSVTASHYSSHLRSSVNISNTMFHLPRNMPALLAQQSASSFADGGDGDDDVDNDVDDEGEEDGSGCFQARATSFQQNPFVYRKEVPKENVEVQSEVVSLDVFSCDGERHLAVEKLDADDNVEFTIPLTSSMQSDWEHQLSRSHMSIHQFNISQYQEKKLYLTLLINLAPIPASSRPFPITAIISQHWPPHPQQSMFRQDFPKEANELRMFLGPGSLTGGGTYNLGLVETSLNSGRRPKMEVSQRHYALSAWFGSCLFWNTSTTLWSDQGCYVTARTTTTVAHCKCNHLTAFGSHFELVPNDLSFTDVEHFFGLHENPVVVVLVTVVLVTYIILLIIARRADNHDMRKGGLVCLSDNNISDSQLYEVVLDTGLQQTTPMTAKISIILHGELGMSETRELISEDDRPMFDRSSRDRFLITLPDSLGRICKVQLWHNNAGPSPRWFLTQVLVRDLNSGKVQYFLCEKWFAVDEGDGRVERELVALDNAVPFMQILVIKGRQYMADFHTWGSVFTRPSYSHFTRAQRLTCCLTLFLAYMGLNAMWYQRQPEQRRGEFGMLDVSWRSLAVGAICCAVVFPIHLFLAFLFRRSRASHTSCEHRVETNNRNFNLTTTPTNTNTTTTTTNTSANTPAVAPHSPSSTGNARSGSISQYADTAAGETVDSTQTMTTYSLLDQSILNWQSIQDWAQRQWVKRQQSTRSSAVSVKTNAQPSSQPCPTQPVQHTLLADEETDQASSGFEDAVSQATAERHRVKPASVSSSDGRRSHLGEDEGGGPHICLPAWCRYVAWTLCVVICFVSVTVTILYGFRFGPAKSMFWLQSLYFSFTICIFFAQPFWIIITVICLALKNRNNPAVFDHCCERSQVQEGISAWHSRQKQILENSDESTELERGVRARQRSRYLRFSRPPQDKFLQESRKKLTKEKNAANFLREVVVFVLMFTLVCVMAYGKDFSAHYMMKNSLDNLLLRSHTQSFHAIQSIPDWHRWAQSTLLDALYGNGVSPGLLMKDGQGENNNILIGHPFLRQLRVQEQPCPESPHLPLVAQLCRYGYSANSEEVGSVNDSWLTPPGGSAAWGQMALYGAGGFGMMLNESSKEDAWRMLQAVEANEWLDRQTRAVIVELTVLNIPTNLFRSSRPLKVMLRPDLSSAVLLLELPPSGGAVSSPRITSTCLFRYVSTWDNCVLACQLLFVLLAMVRLQSELATMIEEGHRYFTWPWNYARMLLCVTALVYVVCYIYRFVLVAETVEFLRNTYYEQFISLAFLAAWDELMQSLVGLLVFLVVVTQGLRLLRYCPHLAKFTAVYRRSRREVMLMALLFLVIMVAFSNAGTLLFGSLSFSMRNMWSATLAVSALTTGIYSPPDLEAEGSPWFATFAVFCTTLGCGLLMCYAVATLTHRLRASRSSDLLVMGKCELLDYCWQQLLLFIGVRKHTPLHEPEVDLPPECTLAEFEYQVEELLFRMNALAGTTNLPEKPTSYVTDSDQSQAIGDDGISSGGSEPAVDRSGTVGGGEEGRLEQRVQKIEDKLYANEPYLAQLLKLDSIGADILSQEKEKKLRSHLEMEIFRQLQMRRQENGEVPGVVDTSATSTSPPSSAIATATTACEAVKAGQQQYGSKVKTLTSSCSSKATENTTPSMEHYGMGGGKADSDEERNPYADLVAPSSNQTASSDDSPGSERALLRGESASRRPKPKPKPKPLRLGSSHLGNSSSKRAASSGLQLPKSLESQDDAFPQCRTEMEPISPRRAVAESDYPEPLLSVRKPCSDFLPPVLKGDSFASNGMNKLSQEPVSVERSDSMRGSRKKAFPDLSLPSMERSDSLRTAGKRHPAELYNPSMERSDSLRAASSKRHPPDLSLSSMERSDSLRAAPSKRHPADLAAMSSMERSDSLRSAGKKPELPPKPTFAVVPVIDSRRSPKPPPLKIPSERVLFRADTAQSASAQGGGSGTLLRPEPGGSGQLGESSSGSDPDGLFNAGGASAGGGRRTLGQGRRNLRKTKSRGKGKGAGTLTPTLLLDELSFTVHQPPKEAGEIGDIVLETCPQFDE